MARIKYYYDTETCKFERVKVKSTDVMINMLGFFSVVMIMGIAILLVFNFYFDTPEEARLKKENKELKTHHAYLTQNLGEVKGVLNVLQSRDDNIYRKIYEAEPLQSASKVASKKVDRYRYIMEKGLGNKKLVRDFHHKIDEITKEAVNQNQSFNSLVSYARSNLDMLEAIPAIRPVPDPDLNTLASGFGMRINPFHKGRTMHEGIDFAAPRGTPVFATGRGIVKAVKSSKVQAGYGNYVDIDHGFGYITKFAHMGKILVKKGQEVNRGDTIGYVGSSGGSIAPHVHYEVIKDGKKIDPIQFMLLGMDDKSYEKLLNQSRQENQSLD